MKVSIVGLGGGTAACLTGFAAGAITTADIICGASRMLADLPQYHAQTVNAYLPADIMEVVHGSGDKHVCVVFSGDTGFRSGATNLITALEAENIPYRVFPGLSSIQLLAAALGRPWENWNLCSSHGVECDPVFEVMKGRPTFFLTTGKSGAGKLCAELTAAGLGTLPVAVAENLSYENETLHRGTAGEFANRDFGPLNVLWAEAAPLYPVRVSGIPDEEFIRTKVPMTKQEVRASVLSKLSIRPEDICWDVGSGTGSVSIEMAQHSRRVYACEKNQEAYELSLQNREKFCAWNLTLKSGGAPEALEDMPAPDAVFVGGSGGHLKEILALALEKNPQARLCVSAIALETLHEASAGLKELGCSVEICQIAVSRAKPVASLNLLMAQNPIFLISGKKI